MTPKEERSAILRRIQERAMAISRAQLLIFILKKENLEDGERIKELETRTG